MLNKLHRWVPLLPPLLLLGPVPVPMPITRTGRTPETGPLPDLEVVVQVVRVAIEAAAREIIED